MTWQTIWATIMNIGQDIGGAIDKLYTTCLIVLIILILLAVLYVLTHLFGRSGRG